MESGVDLDDIDKLLLVDDGVDLICSVATAAESEMVVDVMLFVEAMLERSSLLVID